MRVIENGEVIAESSWIKADEFLPVVVLVQDKELEIKDTKEKVSLSEHLEEKNQKATLYEVTTNEQKLTLAFEVKQGYDGFWEDDDDGYVRCVLTDKDGKEVDSQVATLKKKDFFVSYETKNKFNIDIEVKDKKAHTFYLDFYANDDDDDNKGEYEDVFCGRVKVEYDCCNKANAKLDKLGFIQGMGYIKKQKSILEHGELKSIKAIVLHRTDSEKVESIIGSSDEGTHFWIEKDGTVFQAASLFKKTWHVGSGLYSKKKDETGIGDYENVWPHKKRGELELKKNYPDRYPINSDSVGIEVAGKWMKTEGKYKNGKYKNENKGIWEDLTPEQFQSIVCLCKVLKRLFKLSNQDIYAHDDIKPKTYGEASSYIKDVLKSL